MVSEFGREIIKIIKVVRVCDRIKLDLFINNVTATIIFAYVSQSGLRIIKMPFL